MTANNTPDTSVTSGNTSQAHAQPPSSASSQRSSSNRGRSRRGRRPPQNRPQTDGSVNTPSGNTMEPAHGGRSRRNRSRRNNSNRQNTSQTANAVEEEEKEVCWVCAETLQYYAIGSCNHLGVCSKCAYRMRSKLNDRSCVLCTQTLDTVVVSSTPGPFESFQLWGESAGPNTSVDDATDMIFYNCREQYNYLMSLESYKCRLRKCKRVCTSLAQLKDHMKAEHSREFCDLCLTHEHFFLQEYAVYTKNGLKAHNQGKEKDKDATKDLHPMCQFCKRRYYSDKELYEHLERDHFKCHLCNIDNEYYRNYSSLETHFRQDHFLCEDARCLANRFVVFPNDVEYQAHMRHMHGVQSRLQVNFQVGNIHPNDAVDLHRWNYTAARQETPSAEAFPALPTPATPSAPSSTPAPAIQPTTRAPEPSRVVSTNRAQVMRNQRLAQALGVQRPAHQEGEAGFEEEMKTPAFSTELIEWAKANPSYLHVVERRLERVVKERNCHSVSLRPMEAEERKVVHELASYYGVESQSFGEDPYRRISFYKRENMHVPSITLSQFNAKQDRRARGSRLRYLPLPGSQPPVQEPVPPPVTHGANRGWEKIEEPRREVVLDAWSDED